MTTSRRSVSMKGNSHARDCSKFAMMLRWSSIAPFATPVVPPVYCRNAMSSWPSGTRSSARWRPSASASESRIDPGSVKRGTIFFTWRSTKSTMMPLNPSNSPIDVTMMLRTFVCPMIACKVCAKFSTTTIVSAPESAS